MSFWQELTEKVKQNKLATNITVQVLAKIKSAQIEEFIIVKPAFYFGQIYTLCLDYLHIVEDLLSAPPESKFDVVKGLLFIREAASSLLSDIKALAVPLEGLVLAVDDRYEQKVGNTEVDESGEEEMKDEFVAEEASLIERLHYLFETAGNSDFVVSNLSRSIAGFYRECVHFAKAISELLDAPDGDLEMLLSILLDIQYGLEWQVRFMVEEDVLNETKAEVSFSPGLLTWSSLALTELVPSLSEAKALTKT
jgi:hypothetical protein